MDILVAVASKVAELTVEPIGRQFGYMLFFRRNVRELKDQVEKLKAAREAVQHLVEAAERNCDEIERVVRDWMCRVVVMTEEAERFYEKESYANMGCSHRPCLNLWLRHQLSRKAKKMTAEVDHLKAEGNFDKVSFQTLPQSIRQSSEVRKAFGSRISTMNHIMEALADPAVHAIGLYGIGGVGKTTLAKQVAKEAQEKKLFDMVVLVEVKHNSLKEIQSQIADMLGLKFDMQSESELPRASRLCQRLEKEKSLLVVLDDLWERLDLDQVGIPIVYEGNGRCKVLLTSRNEDLLSSQMSCKRIIKVELLSKEEAWVLFKEKAEINDDPDLLSVAAEVCQKCAQLPIAIVTVAGALRNKKSLREWKDALRRLKSFTSRNITGIKEVDSSLKLSYEYLESKELKSTFLLSAMFSQDASIEDLLMYCVGLSLLQDVHNMEEARDRIYTLVYKLKASSLLFESHSKDRFTMHDVVRDLALSIAFEEQHALVLRDRKVDEWPYEDQPESCAAICLYNSDINKLPEELYAPKVELLSLNSVDRDLRIPSGFFKGLQELKVLNLTNMAFSSLPFSFNLLKKLMILSLKSCTLEDITIVEHLKKLRVLNLSFSTITRLPHEVGQLSCLQMLNLSYCRQLKVIPPNILSNLKKLEELYMLNSFNQWEAEGLHKGKERASLVELKHLQKLSTLEVDIPDVTVLPKGLFVGNSLERYEISIGTSGGHYSGYEFSRKLTLELNKNIDLDYGVFTLLESVEDLGLQNLNGLTNLCQLQSTAQTFCKLQTINVRRCDQLKSLFSISMIRTLSRLEKIEVTECKSMEEIVAFVDEKNVEKGSATNVVEFPQLRYLTLKHLSTLTDSCFSNKVFPKLEKLTLSGRQAKMMWNCNFQAYHFPKVKSLYLSYLYDRGATFPYGLFHGFPNLERLQVSNSSIEVIFSSSRPLHHDAQNVAPFTNLNLGVLKRLKHIWNEKCQSDLILQNLVTLRVSHCDDLINLGPSFVSLANLTDLVVFKCDKLINLLTSSTATTLVQLTRLSITHCNKIEEIITDGEVDVETEIVFMKLKILELNDLANCKNFCCHNYAFNFPLLNEVTIRGCPRFKMFCPGFLTTPSLKVVKVGNDKIKWQSNLNETIQQLFDEKVLFRDTYLKIDEYPELIDIWNGKQAVPNDGSFSNLTNLVMDKCNFLSNHVIPSYVLTSLINLKGLEVRNCDSVEVVFDLEGIDIEKDAHTLQAIPLSFLMLDHLPKLKYVWNKDPHTADCFQNLVGMYAYECESLTSIFPASIAKGLSKLHVLQIKSCGVEVIVTEGQTPATIIRFEFPQLEEFVLTKLPNLKNFYPQRHTVDWPRLRDIDVRQCKKLKVFDWEVSKKTERDAVDEVQNEYPLFFFEKVIPNLHKLFLNQNGVKIIKNGQSQDDFFHEVRYLNLDSFDEDKPLLFPYSFLERFPSLSSLTVSHSSFKDIFPFQRSGSDSSRKVPQLASLTLTHLEQLQHIWNEDSHIHPILQILKRLNVSHCSRLINLSPSSSSFNNLKWLKVSGCHGLSSLLTAATMRTLVCLETLEIQDCKMMEEIVTYEGEDVEEKIVLENLHQMTLIDLPILKSFYGQTCAFEFPLLTNVNIRGCPKMKMFCGGTLATPLLKAVEIEENEERWKGNLNKTLEHLFLDKEC